jgi:hypothetical protein
MLHIPLLIRYISRGISYALFLSLLVSCAAHRLHEAQSRYNEAARIESGINLSDVESDPLMRSSEAVAEYRLALGLVDEALRSPRLVGDLKRDDLYGNALLLKALCKWRISELNGIAESGEMNRLVREIKAEVNAEKITLGTRDNVLLHALPALHEYRRGLEATKPSEAVKWFSSSITTLDAVLTQTGPPPDHPVRAYVRLSQLSSLRAWKHVARSHLKIDPHATPNEVERQLAEFNKPFLEKYSHYRDLLLSENGQNLQKGITGRLRTLDKEFGFQPGQNRQAR